MNRTSVRIIIIDIMLAERYRSYQDNDYYYCLKSYSQISDITVRKTSIIGDGRAFLLEPWLLKHGNAAVWGSIQNEWINVRDIKHDWALKLIELIINIKLYGNLPEYSVAINRVPLQNGGGHEGRFSCRQQQEQRYKIIICFSRCSRAAAICLLSGGWTMARADRK